MLIISSRQCPHGKIVPTMFRVTTVLKIPEKRSNLKCITKCWEIYKTVMEMSNTVHVMENKAF